MPAVMPAAVSQAHVVWDEGFTAYRFGADHPMNPLRLDLTARLCRELGILDLPGVRLVSPVVADDALLTTVHDADYVAAVRAASLDPGVADLRRGLGTEDDPAFLGMHEASARVVAGTVDVARAVWRGEAEHGVNFCGGLHHAMPGRASGFCIYNDAAIGIQWLLDHGAERVAYVDVDAHHGDGVERVFWDDPRVLTISLHESGRVLFPGSGFAQDVGGPSAQGSAVNISLPPGTGDSPWLRAFYSVVPSLLRSFRPEILVTQQGCDSHYTDPLAHLALSIDAQRTSYESLHRLSHELCDGRWVALGGGGYELVGVVPRAWTHLTAIAAHTPISLDEPVPESWREYVRDLYGRSAPARMGDGVAEGGRIWWRSWEVGYDPADPVDQAIMATRQAVYPLHGLDVWFD